MDDGSLERIKWWRYPGLRIRFGCFALPFPGVVCLDFCQMEHVKRRRVCTLSVALNRIMISFRHSGWIRDLMKTMLIVFQRRQLPTLFEMLSAICGVFYFVFSIIMITHLCRFSTQKRRRVFTGFLPKLSELNHLHTTHTVRFPLISLKAKWHSRTPFKRVYNHPF